MKNALYIVPECFVETNLVETLLELKGCNHQSGITNVFKTLEGKLKDRFAIGIVDYDRRKPSSFSEYNNIASYNHIHIFNHSKIPHHYVIFISPAQEQFILDCAEIEGIELSEFKIPDNLEDLKIKTKDATSKNDPDLKRLFKRLGNIGEMKILKNILEYLDANKYSSNLKDLESLVHPG